MRAAIKKLLAADARFEVVGEAKDGRDAVDKVQALKPDVCTMDFNMPILDGAGAVREIMQHAADAGRDAVGAHARGRQARRSRRSPPARSTSWPSRRARSRPSSTSVGTRCVDKVAAARARRGRCRWPRAQAGARAAHHRAARRSASSGRSVVVVGVSTGGPAALGRFLPRFPADTSLALIVVQHLPAGFTARARRAARRHVAPSACAKPPTAIAPKPAWR